jgi:hypothetical protein
VLCRRRTQLSDTACYAGYTAVHGTDACATSSSDACTTLACTGTASLWSIASPSTMCEYFAGDDVRAWEPDCAGSSAFRTAAEAALAGAPCEDGLQALVDDLTTVCNRVDNSWTTVRCVPTEEATEANVAACNAVAAPTSAGDCTAVAECEYLDPSTLKSVWEGWGCVDGTVAETACPVKCQAQIDHYCKPKGTCRPLLLLLLLLHPHHPFVRSTAFQSISRPSLQPPVCLTARLSGCCCCCCSRHHCRSRMRERVGVGRFEAREQASHRVDRLRWRRGPETAAARHAGGSAGWIRTRSLVQVATVPCFTTYREERK